MKTMKAGGCALGVLLALVVQVSAESVRVPEDFNDAKVIASILTKRQVANCVAEFDVAGIDSVKRLVYKGVDASEYTFEGTVVGLGIARGRKTMTIVVEKKMDHTGPYFAYTCSVK